MHGGGSSALPQGYVGPIGQAGHLLAMLPAAIYSICWPVLVWQPAPTAPTRMMISACMMCALPMRCAACHLKTNQHPPNWPIAAIFWHARLLRWRIWTPFWCLAGRHMTRPCAVLTSVPQAFLFTMAGCILRIMENAGFGLSARTIVRAITRKPAD